jgi:hypothetical protein
MTEKHARFRETDTPHSPWPGARGAPTIDGEMVYLLSGLGDRADHAMYERKLYLKQNGLAIRTRAEAESQFATTDRGARRKKKRCQDWVRPL